MKPIFTLLLAIGLPIFSFGQIVPTSCEAPDSVKMRYEFDAKIFAVESMQGTPLEDSVIIPTDLIEAKLKLLLAVHNGFGLAARDTVVDCLDIHLDSIEHSLRHVSVLADTGVVWLKNLAAGISPTGNPAVDALVDLFGLTVQEHYTWSSHRDVLLMTDQDYNTVAIAKKFMAQDSVIDAHHHYGACWGCDQIYQEFPPIDTFVILKYLHCWGDDCGYHRVWEFHLPLGCEEVEFAGSYADLLPEGICDGPDAAGDFSVFEKFEVAPSPADDFCFVKITAHSNMHGRLYLLNLPGQILKSQEINLQSGQENQAFFETSHLPNGLYFLTLKLDNQFFTKKIIIHHR